MTKRNSSLRSLKQDHFLLNVVMYSILLIFNYIIRPYNPTWHLRGEGFPYWCFFLISMHFTSSLEIPSAPTEFQPGSSQCLSKFKPWDLTVDLKFHLQRQSFWMMLAPCVWLQLLPDLTILYSSYVINLCYHISVAQGTWGMVGWCQPHLCLRLFPAVCSGFQIWWWATKCKGCACWRS